MANLYIKRALRLLPSFLSVISAASSVSTTLVNSVQYKFDTDGNAIDLTSGKIDFLGSAYVWYGLTFGCGEAFCGVATYSSTDLNTWHYNGLLFDPSTTQIKALCGGQLSGNCGRPHIIYSAANDDYVLWVNAHSPGYAIFTSSSPTGGFVQNPTRALVGFQPTGPFTAGDFSVHVISGTGYIAYSLIDLTTIGASIWPPFNQSIYIQRLTPDMRNTTGPAYHVISNSDLIDYEAESPDIFKRGDYFYITASNTCGFCTGTSLVVYRSKKISGPWERQIISADTCGGQTTGVLTLPSPNGGAASYLHVADLFRTAPLVGSEYIPSYNVPFQSVFLKMVGMYRIILAIWMSPRYSMLNSCSSTARTAAHGHQFQLLQFNPDGSLKDLDCTLSRSVTVSLIPGSGVPRAATGRAVSATDGSGESGSYSVSCNLPYYQLYQTWTSSKSGNLTEVGVNIAGDLPSANTTFTVFRYSSKSALVAPHFVWETLATFQLAPRNTAQALQVTRISVGKQVTKGDHLGLAIVTASITPLCTLIESSGSGHDFAGEKLDAQESHTLFAIGTNQVSFRGANGNVSPVQTLVGQQIKWYATVT
ncbi:hypothetical protein B2J93_7417 [Marssonina coronariae]|uniref:Glycoside hydrolase family 43 protein n=1 Tax=Diplocarpon coronariae TaxID=2795749 RepID=A0A218Z5Q6_9HELO|nr:hypothetical protein B2J93_7417 [Marssonina coronariae]